MTPEQEETISKAIPLLKEFVTRPEILAQLKDEGKKVIFQEILQFENDLNFRKQTRLLREKQEEIAAKVQTECPHIAGSLLVDGSSGCRDIANRTSIVWHRLYDGGNPSADAFHDVGVCTICLRKFLPEDEDYLLWRKKPSFNRLSTSGIERPMEEGETPDFEYLPTSQTFYEYPQHKTEEDLLRGKNFEDLSDFEIAKLMEYVRESRRKAKQAEETK